MAALEAGEVQPESTLKQLNVIWQHDAVPVLPFVGVGASYRPRLVSQANSPRPAVLPAAVLTRNGTATSDVAEVYFSVSTYGYDCPSPVQDEKIRIPHYVWKYNSIEERCSVILPSLEVHDFGVAVVNENLLVAVGGETDAEYKWRSIGLDGRRITGNLEQAVLPTTSRKLQVLKVSNDELAWESLFPLMSFQRKQPAVVCVEQYLIVAGGVLNSELLSSVEVLNTENRSWS